jgi:HEAT repeat protein
VTCGKSRIFFAKLCVFATLRQIITPSEVIDPWTFTNCRSVKHGFHRRQDAANSTAMRGNFQTTRSAAARRSPIIEWRSRVLTFAWFVFGCLFLAGIAEIAINPAENSPADGAGTAVLPRVLVGEAAGVSPSTQLETLLSNLNPAGNEASGAVPVLLAALRDSEIDATLRARSAAMLGRIGEPARGAVSVLIEILEGERISKPSDSAHGQSPTNDETSYWAMKSLGLFGNVAGDAVPSVSRVLTSPASSSKLRVLAADTLGQIRTAASIDVLTTELMKPRGLSDYDSILLRQTIIDSLALAGPLAVGAIPALARALEDDNSDVRRKACDTLAALGPRAEGAMDSLIERLVLDEDAAVKDAAANALAQVGQPAVAMLADLLERGGPDLQWRAARALGQTGTAARSVIPKLEHAFENSSTQVRIEAVDAVWIISRDSHLVASALVKLLSEDDRQVRRRAAGLLVELKPLPRETSVELEELAAGGSSNESRAAAYVLRERSRKADQ